MIFVYPNTISTFTGDKEIALASGYIEVEKSVYDNLVETKKIWVNNEIVDDPTYPERKAKEEEERKQREAAEAIAREVAELKAELAKYDYIGVKIAMGVATREEYATEIAYTETVRERIRELEN